MSRALGVIFNFRRRIIKKIFREHVRPAIKASVSSTFLDLYGKGDVYLAPHSGKIAKIFCSLLSPTWWLASVSGEDLSKEERTKAVISRNYFYLCASLVLLLVFAGSSDPGLLGRANLLTMVLMIFLLYAVTWGRCNEILIAFIRDALDKTTGSDSKTNLTFRKRIELAFLSYIELISNFAFLFYLMPLSWFDLESGIWGKINNSGLDLSVFENIFDAIYFSGVTITTLGYGDYSPQHWLPKLLVVHEVLVGFTLIIVSFAIYAGRGLALDSTSDSEAPNKSRKTDA